MRREAAGLPVHYLAVGSLGRTTRTPHRLLPPLGAQYDGLSPQVCVIDQTSQVGAAEQLWGLVSGRTHPRESKPRQPLCLLTHRPPQDLPTLCPPPGGAFLLLHAHTHVHTHSLPTRGFVGKWAARLMKGKANSR